MVGTCATNWVEDDTKVPSALLCFLPAALAFGAVTRTLLTKPWENQVGRVSKHVSVIPHGEDTPKTSHYIWILTHGRSSRNGATTMPWRIQPVLVPTLTFRMGVWAYVSPIFPRLTRVGYCMHLLARGELMWGRRSSYVDCSCPSTFSLS